jgi:ATP-dependent protease ClpP protease subunit
MPMPMPHNDNMKNNEFHTLFSKDVPAESMMISPGYKKHTFYLTDFAEYGRGLHEVYNSLRDAGENDLLEIRISSPGGFVTEGQTLYNLIQEMFSDRCITILDPEGYSMGALAFCMGDYRVCYENSSIMYHNYSAGTGGKGHEIIAHVKHMDKSLKMFFDTIVIGLSDEEKEVLYGGGDFWFDTQEMCERKICTAVMVGPHIFSAEEYLMLIKRMNKEAKKLGIKKPKSLMQGKKFHDIDVITTFIEEQEEKERREHEEHENPKKKKTKKKDKE